MQVLLAEDDLATAEMYRMQLTADGFQVALARDGEKTLELARELVPDLVVLDMEMPRLDGIGTLKAIRADARTKNLPVVVLSNSPASTRMEDAYELGIRAWLVKSATTPIQLSGILRVMLATTE